MTKDETAERIAALERELADLKAAVPKPAPAVNEADVARYRDEMHAMRERNASVIPPWMREAVRGGVSDSDCADIKRVARAPQGPSSEGAIPSLQMLTGVRPGGGACPPGGGTGWQREIPLSTPPGVNWADRLMDAQDAKDRAELIRQQRAMKP